MRIVVSIVLALCSLWTLAQDDVLDVRRRTFVYPKRIVWQSRAESRDDGWPVRAEVENAGRLLERRFGQVCEGPFGRANGARLLNRGNDAGLVLDFGRELHGGIQLGMSPGGTSGARVRVRFGESVGEAMSSIGEKCASNDHTLRDFVLQVPSFGSVEVGNTGFRFVRLDLVSGGEVGLEFVRAVSLMRPMKEIGWFRSSDERLNRVYETALRTVHLCCQDYLWDGIKRDRLVWLGDLHPETMVVLNVFGADPILRETLEYAIAVTPPDQWMNTMAPYTLWFLRNVAAWYRYSEDHAFLVKHADYLMKTLAHVRGGLSENDTWKENAFLDWPTKHNPKAVQAGMQGLCAMAFDDAAFLLDALGKGAEADGWRERAAAFRRVKQDPNGAKSAAAVLALGGCADLRETYRDVLSKGGHCGVSTFYGYYVIEAMSEAGEGQRALDTVRDYWGGMLDVGATSFWENFDLAWTNGCTRLDEMPVAGKKDVHGDFGEFCYPGYRHSLCHGWAGGPAAWCINRVLGIRPLSLGCRTVEVKPCLGDLAWAEGAMALPDGGAVRVRAEKRADGSLDVRVDAPDWVRIVREGDPTGPDVTWRPAEPGVRNGLGAVSLDPALTERIRALGGTVAELPSAASADDIRRALTRLRDEGQDRYRVCPFRCGVAGADAELAAELAADGLDKPDFFLSADEDAAVKLKASGMVPTLKSRRFNTGVIYPSVPEKGNTAYPASLSAAPLRGVMLPDERCKEDDFKTLHDWGATLARYQMTLFKPTHTDTPHQVVADFLVWLEERLDHLDEVLGWAGKYGIRIIVDLHSYPGGAYGETYASHHSQHDARMFHERVYGEAFVEAWRRIGRRFAGRKEIYGFDFANEVWQTTTAKYADYWTMQRRAGEIVRSFDPQATLVVECCHSDNPWGFEVLSPLPTDNVVYQVHMYLPHEFTHQGLGKARDEYEHKPYPNPEKGWDIDFLRRELKDVVDFQRRTGARILVGEFSAIAWADGADRYLADCIKLFNEYGWDWTYHAFREFRGWDVEKETAAFKGPGSEPRPSPDNPRMRVLKAGLRGE